MDSSPGVSSLTYRPVHEKSMTKLRWSWYVPRGPVLFSHQARYLAPADRIGLLSVCALSKLRAPGSPVFSQTHHLLCVSQPSTLLLLQDFVPLPSGTADLWETNSPAPSDLSSNIPYPEVSNRVMLPLRTQLPQLLPFMVAVDSSRTPVCRGGRWELGHGCLWCLS